MVIDHKFLGQTRFFLCAPNREMQASVLDRTPRGRIGPFDSPLSVPIPVEPDVHAITLQPNRNKSSIVTDMSLDQRRGLSIDIPKEVYQSHDPNDGRVANVRVQDMNDREREIQQVKKALGHTYNHATPATIIHTNQANFHWTQPNHDSRPDPFEMQNHRGQQYGRESAHGMAVVPATESRAVEGTKTSRPRFYTSNHFANKSGTVAHLKSAVDFTKLKNASLPARALNGGIASGGRLVKTMTREDNKVVFDHIGLGNISTHPKDVNSVTVTSHPNKLPRNQDHYQNTNLEIALPLLNLRDRPRPLLSIGESNHLSA